MRIRVLYRHIAVRAFHTAVVFVLMLGGGGCVPYRVVHLEYSEPKVALSDGLEASLLLSPPPGSRDGSPAAAKPYSLLAVITASGGLGPRTRLDSVALFGLADSSRRPIALRQDSSDLTEQGKRLFFTHQVPLPYQDYRVEGIISVERVGSVTTYPFSAMFTRARRTTWGYWPWSILLSP